MTETEKTGLPVKQEVLLEAGVHIGTKIRTFDMRRFVFKRRDDGLYILDLRQSAQRLLNAAKLMSRFSPEDVLVVASRVYSSNPAAKFSQLTEIPVLRGRFIPGTMTNMTYKGFREPKLIFVCDPKGEREAIVESAKNGVPVIALCDTDNDTKFIDYVVPLNNKGKRSLALVFWLLSREIMLSQGKIKTYDEYKYEVHDFEHALPPKEEKKEEAPAEEAEAEPAAEGEESSEKKEEPAKPEEKPAKPKAEEKKPKKEEKKE